MMRSIGCLPNVIALVLACTPRGVEPSVAPAATAPPLLVERASTAAPPLVSLPALAVARRPPLAMPTVAAKRKAITNQPVVRPYPDEKVPNKEEPTKEDAIPRRQTHYNHVHANLGGTKPSSIDFERYGLRWLSSDGF